jgi:hypothetical protein
MYLKRGTQRNLQTRPKTQNNHNIIGTPNQSIRMKNFQKKLCLGP